MMSSVPLDLSNCCITNCIITIVLQKKLAALQTLELFNCDVTQAEGYREKIFEMLESVLYVDGFDRDGEPAPDEDEIDDYEGEGTVFCSHLRLQLHVACNRSRVTTPPG